MLARIVQAALAAWLFAQGAATLWPVFTKRTLPEVLGDIGVTKLTVFPEIMGWVSIVLGAAILVMLVMSYVRPPRAGKEAAFKKTLEPVPSKIFRHEEVVIDGKQFNGCTFDNVTLVYRGRGEWTFIDPKWLGKTLLKCDHPSVTRWNKLVAYFKSLPNIASFEEATMDRRTGEKRHSILHVPESNDAGAASDQDFVPLADLIMRVAGHSWDTGTAIGEIPVERLEATWQAAWHRIRDSARAGHLRISGRRQFPNSAPAASSGPSEPIDADYWSSATIHPGESAWGIEAPESVETSALGDQANFVSYADLQVERGGAIQQMLDSFYRHGIKLRDEFGWRMKEWNTQWTAGVQAFLDRQSQDWGRRFSRAIDDIPVANRQDESVLMKRRFDVFRKICEEQH